MFCDLIQIRLVAGRGGDGMVHFRREKFIPRGGPDGGDGGHGGNIFFIADQNLNTLVDFNAMKIFKAKAGEKGGTNDRHGANGEDLVLKVPPGTIIYDEKHKKIIGDLSEIGQKICIARGGRGGFGNSHFRGSIRQTPTFAEIGEPGQELTIWLELKMIANVGIIGLPNAGKSSFLTRVSKARPKVANYPFTTLIPHLGVVNLSEFGGEMGESFVMADIPGLIEGAHTGKGLGHDFLRHVSRTKVLLHIIDGSSEDVIAAYKTINTELKEYDETLAKRPQIIGINKIDLLTEEEIESLKKKFLKAVPKAKGKLFLLSTATSHGLREILFALWNTMEKERKRKKTVDTKGTIIDLTPREGWTCTKMGAVQDYITDDEVLFGEEASAKIQGKRTEFLINGERIEQIVNMTNFDNQEAIHRIYDVMKKTGIQKEIKRIGGQSGDHLKIAGKTLRYRLL